MELTPALAEATLTEMSALAVQPLALSPEAADRLRAALLYLRGNSEYQILGICADDLITAAKALENYCTALEILLPQGLLAGISAELSNQIRSVGGVYLKFNGQRQTLHADSYSGNHRGVLVSYQSGFAEDFQGTFGHFPLDLFTQN